MVKHTVPILTVLIPAALLITACEPPSQCTADEGNLHQHNLNGQVEVAAEYLYNNRDGVLEKTERRNELSFDACGKLLEENSYDTYGEPIYTKYYTYDRNRNLSQMLFYRNGIMQFRDVYWYDDDHNLELEARYDLSGEMEDRKVYERDEEGRQTLVREYSSGRKISEFRYAYREWKTVEWVYEYSFSGEERLKSVTISDSMGNVLERQYNGYTIVEYDRGNIVRQVKFRSPRKADKVAERSFDYTYDRAGNWIRRVSINAEGDTVSIREREIDYAYNLFADSRQ